jgi:hypothetical protein
MRIIAPAVIAMLLGFAVASIHAAAAVIAPPVLAVRMAMAGSTSIFDGFSQIVQKVIHYK